MLNKKQIKHWYFNFSHKYFTPNNIFLGIVIVIALNLAWGSVSAMDRNYRLQRQVAQKLQEEELMKISSKREELAAEYYKSDEYKEIEVKRRLNLALPGETVVILPENSEAATKRGEDANKTANVVREQSNFEQWMSFLFGGNAKDLQ